MRATSLLNRSWLGLLLAFASGTGLVVVLASCADSQRGPARHRAGGPEAHAIHSDELAAQMRDLEYRTKEEIAAEIYTGGSVSRMSELEESAGALARSAEKIPDILNRVDMTPEERRAFLAINDRLIQHARALQTDAKSGNVAAARRTMERVNATCDACHNQFRFVGAE